MTKIFDIYNWRALQSPMSNIFDMGAIRYADKPFV